MKNTRKRIVATILAFAICLTCIGVQQPSKAEAATKYISRINFLKLVMKEIGVEVTPNKQSAYISKAKELGLITDKTFVLYNKNISKVDAAVILVRAENLVYGENKDITDDLVNEIITKRISDIKKVSKAKQPFLAKAYALGYIKGNSNGEYSTNRTFNPNYKITNTYAKQLVSLINDEESRHTISPDGQLIRTTKLPEFAKYYPYILASYPNKYYDQYFGYMKEMYTDLDDLTPQQYEKKNHYIKYVAPFEFNEFGHGKPSLQESFSSRNNITAEEFYNKYAQQFEDNCREYLKLVFNVNYKTISKNDNAWKKKVLNTTWEAGTEDSANEKRLGWYLEAMKKNQTIVQFDKIAVDKSTMYIDCGEVYLRAYVKFRVKSSKNDLNECLSVNPLVYTYATYPLFENLELGKWHESYFDIRVHLGKNSNGVFSANYNDYWKNRKVVMK